jgi:hypothetical protein
MRSADVPRDAPSVGGSGPETVSVTVVDPFGVPLPGAALVAYWTKDCGGCHVLQYVKMRTDASGQALVHHSSPSPVTFVASHDGYSEEWLLDESSATVRLNLFPVRATATYNLTWGTANATLNGPYPACQLMDFSLGGELPPAAWIRHAVEANITLSWTNGLDGVADLEVLYLAPPAPFTIRASDCPGGLDPDPMALLPGPHESTLHLTRYEVEQEFQGTESIPEHFYVGPVAKGPAVAIGLPYQLRIEARLAHAPFGDQVVAYNGYGREQIVLGPDGAPSTNALGAGHTAPVPLLVALLALGVACWRRR